CTTDEDNPSSVRLEQAWWSYDSRKLTQYWRVPLEHVRPDLRVRVNGRRVYWAGELEIPGGVSFENFEIRETGEAPYWLEWNFTFKVESHVGQDLKMYDSGKFLGKPQSAQDAEFESLTNNSTQQRNT
ncbi:MAG: hypothetical protein IIB62_09905, partial [Proteobacteria bacterium]|nr:hypothetical protein [Pseudomonadota bacterium]